jgi:hypothetical protein
VSTRHSGSQRKLALLTALAFLFRLLGAQSYLSVSQAGIARATITIEAGTAAVQIGPLLYGQSSEFMFEGVKFGVHAELLRN